MSGLERAARREYKHHKARHGHRESGRSTRLLLRLSIERATRKEEK